MLVALLAIFAFVACDINENETTAYSDVTVTSGETTTSESRQQTEAATTTEATMPLTPDEEDFSSAVALGESLGTPWAERNNDSGWGLKGTSNNNNWGVGYWPAANVGENPMAANFFADVFNNFNDYIIVLVANGVKYEITGMRYIADRTG